MKLNEIIKLFLLFMPSIIFAKNKTKIVDLNTKIIFDDKWLITCSLTRLLLVNPEIVTDKFVQQLSFQVSSLKTKSHSGLFCFKAIENANAN